MSCFGLTLLCPLSIPVFDCQQIVLKKKSRHHSSLPQSVVISLTEGGVFQVLWGGGKCVGCEPASAVVRAHRSDRLDCIRKSFLACLHPSGKNEEPLVVAAPRRRGQRGRGGNREGRPVRHL